MSEFLSTTTSMCRVCRRLIPARVLIEEGAVWFHKICPEHGPQEARVYGDAEMYRSLGFFHRQATMPLTFSETPNGCPGSCGLCSNHEQHVCLPIIEITDHCNLNCPICLVPHEGKRHLTRKEVAGILDELIRTEGQLDLINISGGEPTMHPDFKSILGECLSRTEILRISVSTNGLSLLANPDLLRFFADNHILISLQFDGLSDDINLRLRGRKMSEARLQLIDECARLGISLSLTATVAAGINDHAVPEVAALLFEYDHIVSAMFQPATYTGPAAALERPKNAITLPDVIRNLNGAAGGIVHAGDFSPLPCSHPACFSLAFYLKTEDRHYLPIKQLVAAGRYLDLIQNRTLFGTDSSSFDQITEAVYELWSGSCGVSPDSEKALSAIRILLRNATANGGYSPKIALQVAERSIKSIFIHQFMDPDTFDLSRVRKCCQVYPLPNGRLVPACVRNCSPMISTSNG